VLRDHKLKSLHARSLLGPTLLRPCRSLSRRQVTLCTLTPRLLIGTRLSRPLGTLTTVMFGPFTTVMLRSFGTLIVLRSLVLRFFMLGLLRPLVLGTLMSGPLMALWFGTLTTDMLRPFGTLIVLRPLIVLRTLRAFMLGTIVLRAFIVLGTLRAFIVLRSLRALRALRLGKASILLAQSALYAHRSCQLHH
jgi:hypothetical protein